MICLPLSGSTQEPDESQIFQIRTETLPFPVERLVETKIKGFHQESLAIPMSGEISSSLKRVLRHGTLPPSLPCGSMRCCYMLIRDDRDFEQAPQRRRPLYHLLPSDYRFNSLMLIPAFSEIQPDNVTDHDHRRHRRGDGGLLTEQRQGKAARQTLVFEGSQQHEAHPGLLWDVKQAAHPVDEEAEKRHGEEGDEDDGKE